VDLIRHLHLWQDLSELRKKVRTHYDEGFADNRTMLKNLAQFDQGLTVARKSRSATFD